MATIETFMLPDDWRTGELWPVLARQVRLWLTQRQLPPRDAVLLLPFAALLPPARAALAALGGWQPRVETPLTLAASLGPPCPVEPGACQGDGVHDAMAAAALLRQQPWGADWARRDPSGFTRITADVVETAQALREAALTRPPARREAYWAAARALALPTGGPASMEVLLLRVAIEWAALAGTAASDRLFEMRPSAWLTLRIGGADPMAEALLAHADVPSLRLVADGPSEDPWGRVPAIAVVERLLCDDFEAEAQGAAAAVLTALSEGRSPVALVALDREMMRRVRALLARQAVPLIDETGWKLSTTRAAGAVVALLRAAMPDAGPDERLEWLKTWPSAPARALDALESMWRGRRQRVDVDAAERLWAEAQAHLQPLTAAGPRSLAEWLDLLQGLLAREGSFDRMAADPAGVQVLAALGLKHAPAWLPVAAQWRVDLAGFIAWLDATLEAAPYLPPPDAGAPVVLTPLARAFGRGFAHLVVPGADHRHLGAGGLAPRLLTRAMLQALGMDDDGVRRHRQRLALAHVLRDGPVTIMRRLRDAEGPLSDSPDVEWLLLERARAGLPAWPLQPWRPGTERLARRPQARPLPVAAAALPQRLSASQLEALRQCPYRFFARAVLRLDEPDELDLVLAKRDYGTWLHAVLHHFHSQRRVGEDDAAALQQAADATTRAQSLDAGELLPFRASFDHLAPAYLRWLQAREAEGWRWQDGETEHQLDSPLLPGLQLHGRLDRLDVGPAGRQQLLDYKTGSATELEKKLKQPLEDTQLAFYAALLGGGESLGAAYLALDNADAPRELPHPQVHLSAATLIQQLGSEWQRLQQGSPLPALGEGRVCETCESRGLCRRDHWPAARGQVAHVASAAPAADEASRRDAEPR